MNPTLGEEWRKSSYSGGTGGECVEAARGRKHMKVRDSKSPNSGMLLLADASATAWLAAVKAGQFDR